MTPCHRTAASTAHPILVLRPDADELLHSEALMSGDGKELGDDAASEEKKTRERGQHLREQLDKAEVQTIKPQKHKRKKVSLVKEDFGDEPDSMEAIQARMDSEAEERAKAAVERAGEGAPPRSGR